MKQRPALVPDQMNPGFGDGARALLSGFSLLGKPGVRLFVIIPLLINIALFAGTLYYVFQQVGALHAFFEQQMTGWWEWLDWLLWLLWPLLILVSLLVIYFGFVIIANFIAAPFNGFLAAAVEKHLTGVWPDDGGSLKQLPREIVKILRGEISKLGYFAVRALPLLLLFVIPVLNVTAPLIWFLFGAWMLALEYMDFPMGNRGYTFPAIRRIMSGRRRATFGFGMAALLLTMVPVLNFVAMPVAVAGATRLWVEHLAPTHGR